MAARRKPAEVDAKGRQLASDGARVFVGGLSLRQYLAAKRAEAEPAEDV